MMVISRRILVAPPRPRRIMDCGEAGISAGTEMEEYEVLVAEVPEHICTEMGNRCEARVSAGIEMEEYEVPVAEVLEHIYTELYNPGDTILFQNNPLYIAPLSEDSDKWGGGYEYDLVKRRMRRLPAREFGLLHTSVDLIPPFIMMLVTIVAGFMADIQENVVAKLSFAMAQVPYIAGAFFIIARAVFGSRDPEKPALSSVLTRAVMAAALAPLAVYTALFATALYFLCDDLVYLVRESYETCKCVFPLVVHVEANALLSLVLAAALVCSYVLYALGSYTLCTGQTMSEKVRKIYVYGSGIFLAASGVAIASLVVWQRNKAFDEPFDLELRMLGPAFLAALHMISSFFLLYLALGIMVRAKKRVRDSRVSSAVPCFTASFLAVLALLGGTLLFVMMASGINNEVSIIDSARGGAEKLRKYLAGAPGR